MSFNNLPSSDQLTELPMETDENIFVQVFGVHSQHQMQASSVEGMNFMSAPSTSQFAIMTEDVVPMDVDITEEVTVALSSPPPRRKIKRDTDAMKKLTDATKQKIVEYIELMEKVDTPTSVPNQNDNSWIPFFLKIVCRADPSESFTKKDVLVWVKNCPEIFTPQVIASLLEISNRFKKHKWNKTERESLDSNMHVE